MGSHGIAGQSHEVVEMVRGAERPEDERARDDGRE